LELAGVKDVMAKNLGANNPINQVKAVFGAIEKLVSRKELRKRRGLEE
jgi:small subunit ribosomal protein S5